MQYNDKNSIKTKTIAFNVNIFAWKQNKSINSISIPISILAHCKLFHTVAKINYNRIKSVLAEKNKTNRDLSKLLGRTESSVSRWCTNDIQPSIETMYKISKFLDVDIRELLVSTK